MQHDRFSSANMIGMRSLGPVHPADHLASGQLATCLIRTQNERQTVIGRPLSSSQHTHIKAVFVLSRAVDDDGAELAVRPARDRLHAIIFVIGVVQAPRRVMLRSLRETCFVYQSHHATLRVLGTASKGVLVGIGKRLMTRELFVDISTSHHESLHPAGEKGLQHEIPRLTSNFPS